MKKILLFAAVLVGFSACSVNPQHGRVTLRDGTVIENSGGNSKGNFCPPGQAKKGRC